MKRISIFIAGFLLAGIAGWYFLGNEKTDIPSLKSRRGDATATAEFLNAQKAVEYYRDQIRQKPGSAKNYIELAQLFMQEARVTGNHHEYIPKARYLLDEALRHEPGNFDATISKASLLMTLHQFEEARQLAESAIASNPYNAFAHGVLCDALVELGKYDEAVKACDKMLSIRPDLRSYARASYLRELHGDTRGAMQAMMLAANAGVNGQENRAWSLYSLGNLFRQDGNPDTAELVYKAVLEERPDYAYAYSGLAQIQLEQGKTDEAEKLLIKAADIMPEHTFLEQLADIYKVTGNTASATGTEALVLKSFAQHDKDGWNSDKEFAAFCSNHDINLAEALQRAEREYNRRPANIDALDTYAWALYKNGRATDALPLIENALRLGTRNPVLHYHAGIIFKAAGERGKSAAELEKAIHINPFIHILYRDSIQQALASMSSLAYSN